MIFSRFELSLTESFLFSILINPKLLIKNYPDFESSQTITNGKLGFGLIRIKSLALSWIVLKWF